MKRFGVFLAIVGGTLVISTKFLDAYNLPKFVVISLGAAIASLGLEEKHGPQLFRPLWWFLAVVAASCLTSVDPLVSLTGTTNNYFYGFLPLVCAATIFVAASQDGKDIRPALIWTGTLCGAYAVFQGLIGEPFNGISDQGQFAGRAFSFPGSPVLLAAFLVLAIPFAVDRRAWGAAAVMVAGVLFSQSRGGVVGLAATAGCYAWLQGRRKAVVLCGILALVAVVGMRWNSGAKSDLNRFNAWKCAIEQVKDTPFLGSGPDTFVEVYKRKRTAEMTEHMAATSGHYEAHNDVLQVLSTTGLLGLAAYLWWLFTLSRKAWPADKVAISVVFGAFVFAKFSPMPLYTTCACAAIVASRLLCRDHAIGPVAVQGLRLLCIASLGVSILLARAEFFLVRALPGPQGVPMSKVLAGLKQGADAAPWVQDYQAFYSQYLAMAKDRAEHRRIAERNFLYHPDVAMSYHMMAVTEKLDGNKPTARWYLEEARARDPLSLQVEKLKKELDNEQR